MINYKSADYSQIGIYKYESYIEKNQIYINVDFKMTKHQFSIMSNRDYYVKIFVNNKELFNFEIENKFVEDEKEIREYPVEELKFKPRQKKEKLRLTEEEMRALKELEK